MDLQAIIDKAGGPRKLAALLDVSIQAVHKWRKDNRLPQLRVYELRERRPEWFVNRVELKQE